MAMEIWALIEDEKIGSLVEDVAIEEGLTLRRFGSVAEAINHVEPEGGLILVIDATVKFGNYLTIIRRFQRNYFGFETVVFGKEKPPEVIEREMERGVDLYIECPVNDEEFYIRFKHAVSMRRLKGSAGIIGRSKPLVQMLETVLRVAPTEVSVLIEGESGTGKEVTARGIHLMSKRSKGPFEAVNCGAFAEGVLESELFGHERGSFTGAVARKQGLFERANGGTLFLDEVGEMSLNMQVKLLRVIETGEFLRVGGSEKITSDVRLLAATNRELESSVEKGEFRKDLYYRLKVVKLTIPPLRARPVDIPMLINYFIDRSSRRHGKRVRGIEKEAVELMVNYPWPGNVRELSNVIDNLVVLSSGNTITYGEVEIRLKERMVQSVSFDLPVHVEKSREEMERELILNSLLSLHNDVKEILQILKGAQGQAVSRWGSIVEVSDAHANEPKDLESLERDAIIDALVANGGNRKKAAKQLGISERTLYRRIKDYNLK